MKYNLTSINIFSNGAISIDYRKLDDEGKYLGNVGNDSNLSVEVKHEIYESIHKIEALLNREGISPTNKDNSENHVVTMQ